MSNAENNNGAVSRINIERFYRERAKDRQRITELEETIENLQDQIAMLKERTPAPFEKKYGQMTKGEKATVVRSKLKQEAKKTGGKAAVTYNDVIRMFDGYPSTGHAYNLMEVAAKKDGFDYEESPSGMKRLTVDLQKSSE